MVFKRLSHVTRLIWVNPVQVATNPDNTHNYSYVPNSRKFQKHGNYAQEYNLTTMPAEKKNRRDIIITMNTYVPMMTH